MANWANYSSHYEPWYLTPIGMAVTGVAFIGIVGLALHLGNVAQCSEVGDVTGRRTDYRVLSGCYVEVNGRMVPLDSWRGEEAR